MKTIISIFLCLLFSGLCCSQDYIYKKDKSIQKGKILEVTTEKIKYKKMELPHGPTFEIPLSEVAKIRFYTGLVEISDSSLFKDIEWHNQSDTLKFSFIYMVYNSGQDESQQFPIYFNNKGSSQ